MEYSNGSKWVKTFLTISSETSFKISNNISNNDENNYYTTVIGINL